MFRLAARSFAAPLARQTVAAPARLAVQQRFYAASALSHDSIKARIEDVLKSFEKVDATKASLSLNPPRGSRSPDRERKSRSLGFIAKPASLLPFRQVTPAAAFTNDLGLDSLDAVEVVMAIEGVSSHFVPPAQLSYPRLTSSQPQRSLQSRFPTRTRTESPRSERVHISLSLSLSFDENLIPSSLSLILAIDYISKSPEAH